MNDKKTDEVLLAEVVHGERSALKELYDRYERIVYSFAYRYTGNASAAEEIVQDVFIKIWRTQVEYEASRGKVSTWLLTIARSASIDYHRRNHKNLITDGDECVMINLPDPSPGPEQEAELHQLRTMVRKLVQELPADQKVVLEHMYFKGFTQQQIADNLGISVGTVKSRVRLAMQKLRDKLPVHEGEVNRYV